MRKLSVLLGLGDVNDTEQLPAPRPDASYWVKLLSEVSPLELRDKKIVPAHKRGAIHATGVFNVPLPSEGEADEHVLLLLACYMTLLAKYSHNSDLLACGVGVSEGSKNVPSVLQALNQDLSTDSPPAAAKQGWVVGSHPVVPITFSVLESVDSLDWVSPVSASVALSKQLLKLEETLQSYDLDGIAKSLNINPHDTLHPLFQAMFVWDPAVKNVLGELQRKAAAQPFGQRTVPCPLQLRFYITGATCKCRFLFLEDNFNTSTIADLQKHLCTLFVSAVVAKDLSFDALVLTDKTELSRIKTWSECTDGPSNSFPTDQCVHSLFEAQAQASPTKPALFFSGRSISYSEFDTTCGVLASHLRTRGVMREVMVPLIFERGIEMLVAIYGVLKAGGAYVPMDPHYPEARMLTILEEINAKVLLTMEKLKDLVPTPWSSDHVMLINQHPHTFELSFCSADGSPLCLQGGPNLPPPGWEAARGDSPVYVYFTSGTTGKPKGVVVEHKGLTHRTLWLQQEYGMLPHEKTMLKHGYTFGLSEWEIFWPLCCGAGLVLIGPDDEKRPEKVHRLTQELSVTHMFFVPSMLKMLCNFIELEDIDTSSSPLKTVVTCGEALTLELLQKFYQLFPSAQLHNLYGPTEGEMTLWKCPKGRATPYVPIGVPLPGCIVYVCDHVMNLCPVNVPGELHFGGPFIARGYLNLPAKTEEVFIDNPHGPGRLYKTGDLAVWRADGNLEFLGRVDNQVKLRGFRIELSEIESVLRNVGLQQVVVLVTGDGANQMLVAYCAPATEDDVPLLQAECVKRLATYMVPSVIIPLEKIALTDRGKIDRKSLPVPSIAMAGGGKAGSEVVQPRTEIETSIRNIWAQMLRIAPEEVSIQANFQQIGGNSLLAGTITSMLRKEIKEVTIPGTLMYTHATIAKLGQFIQDQLSDVNAPRSLGAALEREPLRPPEERYKGLNGMRPFAVVCQCVALVVITFDSVLSLLGFFASYFVYIIPQYGVMLYCLTQPFFYFIVDMIHILFVLGIKFLLFPSGIKAGKYPVYGQYYFRWWTVHQLMVLVINKQTVTYGGTPVLAWLLRLFGAKVGSGTVIEEFYGMTIPDLVTIGSNTLIRHKAAFETHAIVDGELILVELKIGNYCVIEDSATITVGTDLPDGMRVGTAACTHGFRKFRPLQNKELTEIPGEERKPPRTVWWLPWVGIPYHFLLRSLAMIPAWILAMELNNMLDNVLSANAALYTAAILQTYIFVHAGPGLYILLLILQKRVVVGRFKAKKHAENSDWDVFRTWLTRTTTSSNAIFVKTLEPFVNTEVLRWVYSAMGVKYGGRVQTDTFFFIEADLITISRGVVLGFNVDMSTSDLDETKSILIEREGNVLDHAVLLPGTHVGERALLGSYSLCAKDMYIAPDSVYTGNKDGSAVFLKFNNPSMESSGSAQEKKYEILALQRLEGALTWWSFNIGLIVAAIVVSPLISGVEYVLLANAFALFKSLELWQVLLMLLPVACVLNFGTLLAEVASKWILIGRFRLKNYPFMGSFHFRWMLVMMINRSLSVAMLPGTVFYNTFYRWNGAKVGKNVCNFGFSLEYDMFEAGDYVCIGEDCDHTCHTVERMVLKVAPVKYASYATVCAKSVVMPGGTVEKGALLLERSQVLKGETVPENECWKGLPAEKTNEHQYDYRSYEWERAQQAQSSRHMFAVSEASSRLISSLKLRSRKRRDIVQPSTALESPQLDPPLSTVDDWPVEVSSTARVFTVDTV